MNVPKRWLLLSDGARPTEDIYFLESVAPRLRAEGHEVGRLDMRGWRWRLARWVLSRQSGANLVLCRTLPEPALRWLERERAHFDCVFYLIDDDLAAASGDTTLPPEYRARMATAAAGQARLLALADEVVACSDRLAERCRARHDSVRVMTPPMIAPLPALAHFAHGPAGEQPWRIGFHGTRAHLADLGHIAPALRAIQHERGDTELELMLGEHVPVALADLPRTHCPAPLPWQKFRAYQARRRVHIGLAPLLDTPFNRGKSFIKFLDIAAMGGVGVYSRRSPYTEIVEEGVNGLLAGDDPDEWRQKIEWLLEHPGEALRMAEAAAQTARHHVIRELPGCGWPGTYRQEAGMLPDMSNLLEQAHRIAMDAAAAIMAVYARDFTIEEKDDKSPLTEADKAAHEVIVAGLTALPGGIPVLSEEHTGGFAGADADGRYWLVDPLDGTKEFIKRNGEFTVNIALIEQGRPVLGVVVAPALEVAYLAAEGIGAFKVEGDGERQAIRVAGRPSEGACWRVVGSRSHPSPDLAAWLEALGEHEMLPMGSSLKLCLVAEGVADVYPRLGPTCLWDTGAAQAVVEQAGGRVETPEGEALDYATPEQHLNPHFVVWGQ